MVSPKVRPSDCYINLFFRDESIKYKIVPFTLQAAASIAYIAYKWVNRGKTNLKLTLDLSLYNTIMGPMLSFF